jgi:glycosyltransferase involved in cell wall biosynthesis
MKEDDSGPVLRPKKLELKMTRAGADTSGEPLVSVIMCVYNAGNYLRPSLESILGQTYRHLDIVIVDDGSTDGCIDSIKDLLADDRIRLFRQNNSGKSVALNRALDEVRGEYYAIQDADDVSFPTRIAKQVDAFLKDPQLAAVFCGNELILRGRSVAPLFAAKEKDECERAVAEFCMPAHDPTGMFRMSVVGRLRYDPSLQVAETFDYILRVGERHPMIVLGETLYAYRILENSLTRRDPGWREQIVIRALKKACERRGLQYESTFPDHPLTRRRSANSVRDNNIAAYFIRSVLDQRRANRRLAALATGWDCVRLHPLDPHYYKAMIYALVSPRLLTGGRAAYQKVQVN